MAITSFYYTRVQEDPTTRYFSAVDLDGRSLSIRTSVPSDLLQTFYEHSYLKLGIVKNHKRVRNIYYDFRHNAFILCEQDLPYRNSYSEMEFEAANSLQDTYGFIGIDKPIVNEYGYSSRIDQKRTPYGCCLETRVVGKSTELLNLEVVKTDDRVPTTILAVLYHGKPLNLKLKGVTTLQPNLDLLILCGNRIMIAKAAELNAMLDQDKIDLRYETKGGIPAVDIINLGNLGVGHISFQEGIVCDYTGEKVFTGALSDDLTPHKIINTGSIRYFDDTIHTTTCYTSLDLEASKLTAEDIFNLMQTPIPHTLTGIKFPSQITHLSISGDDFYPDKDVFPNTLAIFDEFKLPYNLIGRLPNLENIDVKHFIVPPNINAVPTYADLPGNIDRDTTLEILGESTWISADQGDDINGTIAHLKCSRLCLASALDNMSCVNFLDLLPSIEDINGKPVEGFFADYRARYLLNKGTVPSDKEILTLHPNKFVEWFCGSDTNINCNESFLTHLMESLCDAREQFSTPEEYEYVVDFAKIFPSVTHINGKSINDFALAHNGTSKQCTLLTARDILEPLTIEFINWVMEKS